MKYSQAYDKIIDAYFKDEIKPMNVEFCFCGTLAPNEGWLFQCNGVYPYSPDEYSKMESGLFKGIMDITGIPVSLSQSHPLYEQALFNGMAAALDVLKSIHIARGEDVDGRKLQIRQLAH